MKVDVDRSDVSVSRCKFVGTLLCRVLTRVPCCDVYPNIIFDKKESEAVTKKRKNHIIYYGTTDIIV